MPLPYDSHIVLDIDGLGSVEADIIVTPGLPPRYGESPDPGHPTEYSVGDVYLCGPRGAMVLVDPDLIAVRDGNGWQRLTDHLIYCAPSAIGEVQP